MAVYYLILLCFFGYTESAIDLSIYAGRIIYLFDDFKRSFYDVQRHCENLDGTMAKISTASETYHVQHLITTSYAWIGIEQVSFYSGTYQFVGGQRVTYTRWKAGQPNGDGICVVMGDESDDGRWSDDKCRVPYGTLCQFEYSLGKLKSLSNSPRVSIQAKHLVTREEHEELERNLSMVKNHLTVTHKKIDEHGLNVSALEYAVLNITDILRLSNSDTNDSLSLIQEEVSKLTDKFNNLDSQFRNLKHEEVENLELQLTREKEERKVNQAVIYAIVVLAIASVAVTVLMKRNSYKFLRKFQFTKTEKGEKTSFDVQTFPPENVYEI